MAAKRDAVGVTLRLSENSELIPVKIPVPNDQTTVQ